MNFDPKKFSFPELTSNKDGKTSMSGLCGGIICIIGTIVFAYSSFTKQTETVNQAVMVITIGASLLGLRKVNDRGLPISTESKEEDIKESDPKEEVPNP